MDKAETDLTVALEKVTCDADVFAAFEAYYVVVEQGITALWLDTNDRNSLTTLQSVYRKKWRFGDLLRRFMEEACQHQRRRSNRAHQPD